MILYSIVSELHKA